MRDRMAISPCHPLSAICSRRWVSTILDRSTNMAHLDVGHYLPSSDETSKSF